MDRLGTLTSVDGIPAYVGTSTRPQLAAGLVIRAGECDEQLPFHGISHLVEHLSLSRVGRRLTNWNGFVDQHTTNFVIQGRPEEIVEFFGIVNETLLNPPYERIATEAQVLRTEAANHGGRGVLAQAMLYRVGPRNYGLRSYTEFCFEQPRPELVHQWISRHYNTSNMAFWCTGALPEGLRLTFPTGDPAPIPVPTWIDEPYPAFTHENTKSIVLTLIGEWNTQLLVTASVVREHLFEVLRTQHGLSYGVDCQMESIACGRLLHAAISADGLAENMNKVRDIMSAELNRLAWDGPAPDDLARFIENMRRGLTEAHDEEGEEPVAAQARCHVFGEPFVGAPQMMATAEAMTPRDVATVLANAMRSALWLVPRSVRWGDQRVSSIRPWSAASVQGSPVPIMSPETQEDVRRLVLANEGVTMQFGAEAHPITVRFDDVAAILAHTGGDRTLIGYDGFQIVIEAQRWPDAADLVRFIDSRVPADRMVYLPDRGETRP